MTELFDLARLSCVDLILCIYILCSFKQYAVLVVLIDEDFSDHIAESANVVDYFERHLRNDLRV